MHRRYRRRNRAVGPVCRVDSGRRRAAKEPAMAVSDARHPARFCTCAAARTDHPAARRRALARVRAAAADRRPARPVYRLSVRQGRAAGGDRHQGRRARPLRRPRTISSSSGTTDIFRVAVWNTFLYTFVTTVFKLALGLWLALLLNRHFRGKAFIRAFILLAVHHSDGAVDLRLEVDVRSDLQRDQLDAVPSRHHPQPHQLARRSRPGDDLGDHRQCLARRAVLRDQPARRAADDQPRTA